MVILLQLQKSFKIIILTKESFKIIVIAITFHSSSCLGQETPKGPFGFRVKLQIAHLSATPGERFSLFL